MKIVNSQKLWILTIALSNLTLVPAKANWDHWAVDYGGDGIGNRIFTVNSSTGERTLRSTRIFEGNGWRPSDSYIDSQGQLVIYNGQNRLEKYNLQTNTWTLEGSAWTSLYQKVFERPSVVGNSNGTASIGIGDSSLQIEADGKGISTSEGSKIIRIDTVTGGVNIGGGSNPVSITQEGINVGGVELINKRTNGEIHIGENSLITVERNGVQELYATDGNGKAIPINITNGSDLQIDGKSVKKTLQTLETNINNLGFGVAGATALTAAMTALPATSDDSPLSCGVGSGGYSSRYAMGFGCAASVTKRLAFNAGGSFVFGGASNYGGGSLDNVAGRLGFVFKIGKIAPTSNQAISKKAALLESQLSEMKHENQKLTAYLEDMKKLIANQNERLVSLENLANITGSQVVATSRK